ncbi:hypothetical protein NC653_010560 [Populus alba x Populus x berolinensis]|uniref:Uncharacterized protein n=1 Tax=Populus alba x Populus x berolinensis TaxID=444605 RepID=A0AAD6R041_9ROSI|nr:hypothetical protein NC653_010560 [Populus alba x Populus x berolinensis]
MPCPTTPFFTTSFQSVARSSFKLWTISAVEKHEGADSKLIQGWT